MPLYTANTLAQLYNQLNNILVSEGHSYKLVLLSGVEHVLTEPYYGRILRALTPHCQARRKDIVGYLYRSPTSTLFSLGRLSPEEFFECMRGELGLTVSFSQFRRFYAETIFDRSHVVMNIYQQFFPRLHFCGLITDTDRLQLHHLLDTSPELFYPWDDVWASYQVGYTKHGGELYGFVAEHDAIRAWRTKVVYVDHQAHLMHAPRSLGWTCIEYNVPKLDSAL